MGAGVAVRAVILRYLDQVARVRSIRRAAEDLPAERGLDVSYETVRRWVLKFGPDVFGEDRPSSQSPPAVKEKHSAPRADD